MRVLPDAGSAHKRSRHRKRARGGRGQRCEARGGAEHRQGGLPYKRHGYLQGDDGKGDGGHQPQLGKHRHGDLRHPLRQRDGVTRFGDSAIRRASSGG